MCAQFEEKISLVVLILKIKIFFIFSSSVRRLKKTFLALDENYVARFEAIETSLSHQFSYRSYRELLHSITPPCVPYMGVYLTDLTFVLDGNPDKVDVCDSDLVNVLFLF